MRRRESLALLAALTGAAASPRVAAQQFPGVAHRHDRVDPDYRMAFPRDFGAHPGFRTEWWYVTGWLGEDRGFQVTFFRVRTTHPQDNPSRFAPTQLLFAHAALMLPKNRHALHGQRAARLGSSGGRFSVQDADVAINDWSLVRAADDRYRTIVHDDAFGFDLTLAPPGQPGDPRNDPWLQDLQGFSRKGPGTGQASHYYSRPQLQVSGTANGETVSGVAWFDHEWSTTYLDPAAEGWDWTGINLDDGGALVAFRIRPRQPGAEIWRYCALRHPDGRVERFDAVRFEVLRDWQSPRTSTRYPVSLRLVLPHGRLRLEPLFDDQELDGRGSTGTIYWEGAVRVLDDSGKRLGRGYLELTGYQSPLKM